MSDFDCRCLQATAMRKSEEHSTPAELGEGLFLGEELLSIVNVIRSPPRASGDDMWGGGVHYSLPNWSFKSDASRWEGG